VQRTGADGLIQYAWCSTDECYDQAIDTKAKGYAGWTPVTFDESKPFEYTTEGVGPDRYATYRLNPDGTNGYAKKLDGVGMSMSTDWNTQLAIGGLLNGLRGVLGGLLASEAATQASVPVSSGLQTLIRSIEQELVDSGAKTMGQRALAIERVLGKQGLEAVGKLTSEGIKITSKGEITTIAKDGTITITRRATGEVIKQIK